MKSNIFKFLLGFILLFLGIATPVLFGEKTVPDWYVLGVLISCMGAIYLTERE
ncbi:MULTISPECIES: hypothetical protein [Bacillus]|uniref:hypothetical protein n=1 Tax=Bacillus TaxID=1386 RepID=UPI0015D47A66|nr:hypothetical protein [Bacillus cereus]